MSTPSAPPPTLYAMVAAAAQRALVFRKSRGTWRLFAWNLSDNTLASGAAFWGTLYPRRADLSPDGSLLYYFALKKGATYHAVSRAPWLFALALWRDSGTWTRGFHFARGASVEDEISQPDEGEITPLRRRMNLTLARTPAGQYASERRRGWVEHEDCPPRSAHDLWDEQRQVVLAKPRPKGRGRLVLRDQGISAAPGRIEGRRPTFHVEWASRTLELPGVVWADWDHEGRLLIATEEGRLEMREGPRLERARRAHDLSAHSTSRGPAPKWAQTW